MKYPKLIILYGRFQTETNWKQDRMITGGATCGYRSYAQKFGEIIYLAPQECTKPWEKSIPDKEELIKYLLTQPNAIIWSVKHDPLKDEVLQLLEHRKVFYSCCAYNMYNKYCDISLVDLPERVSRNGVLWVKGKDPDYWQPNKRKMFDFLIMGARGDKNELFFIEQMQNTKREYSILWIGGEAFKNRIQSKHEILYTPFLSMDQVRNNIPTAKIGVILSEHPAEGFPQSFLEMTMCGVPVIYLVKGWMNNVYYRNCWSIKDKANIVEVTEKVLHGYENDYSCLTRKYTIENYSLEKSYESILRGLNGK